MLKLMRDQFKNLKIFLWFVVAVFVLLTFVDWGAGTSGLGGGGGDMTGVAARVGDVTVTESAFLKEMRATEDRFRDMYGEQYEALRGQLNLASMTINNLIDRELLLDQAREAGLRVTDGELLDRISSMPVFQREDGSFVGEQAYLRILRGSRLTVEEFETAMRRDMLLEKLQQTIAAGTIIPDPEVEREYRRRNETASFDVLFVPVDRALDRAQPTEEDARAYYDSHQAAFTHPEQRKLAYLLVDDARVRRGMVVPDDELQKYYNEHQDEFSTGERVRARHILVRPATQDDAGWQAAERKINEIRARAAAPGADFAALARQFSEDPGSKESGGDLGFFERGRMVPEFEQAAFSLQPGQVSEPVRSQYGYHIIRLEERAAAGVKPFPQVREQIRLKLAQAMADSEGSRRASALKQRIDAAKLTTQEQWRELADDQVTSNVTPYFSAGEAIPGLGRDPELLAEVSAAKEGTIGGPRHTSRGWIVYRVEDVREAGTTPFEEAKDEALEGARRAKALELLKTELGAKRAELAAGSAQQLAGETGGIAQTVGEHRRGAAIPSVGNSEALEDAVFKAQSGTVTEPVVVGERGVAIAKVTGKQTADPEQLATQRDSVREAMVNEEVQRILAALVSEARRNRDIVVNQELLERFKPEKA